MNITPGKSTSEYTLVLVQTLINAVMALAVMYGLVSAEAEPLVVTICLTLFSLGAIFFTGSSIKNYTDSRTGLKLTQLEPAASAVRPEAAESTTPEYDHITALNTTIDEANQPVGSIFQQEKEV